MDEVLKCDFMVKRAQMRAKLLKTDNYKSRWFRLTKAWLSYYDGKLEVMLSVRHRHYSSYVAGVSVEISFFEKRISVMICS